MNLYQLEYAVKAAEYNSISKAAESLFTSQASCSNAITSLEEELNIKIFKRTNKGVKLTPKGESFIAQAKIILEQTEVLEEIQNEPSSDIKPLKIACHRIFFVSNILVKLYNTYVKDGLKILLNEASRDTVIDDVINGDYDLGLIALNSLESKFWMHILERSGLEYNEIRKEELLIYVGENNPYYNNSVIKLEDLNNLPGIFLPERLNYSNFYNISSNEMLLLGSDKSLYLNDKDTIIKLVRNTTAFVAGMKLGVDEHPEGIKGIPIENEDINFSIGWIKRKDENISYLEKEFINLV